MAHKIADEPAVLAPPAGAAPVGDPRRLNHRRVVAHIIDDADEAVVEHLDGLVKDLFERRGDRPQRRLGPRALRVNFGSLLGAERP